ncbi:MAG: DNA mismatch repair protein MutT [Hydrogenophilales bacterium 28-61-23]|nr:MAG: DNA mismatch repair protein MutT [Hydrogenophilales bacterium 28-61-23]
MADRIEVAAAVIERPDGAFLMARRPEGKAYAGWWEFPGGKLEAGESARQALDRELHEELGIDVDEAWPWLNRFFVYPHANVMLRFFRVTRWRGEPHPHEDQMLEWTHIDAAGIADLAPVSVSPVLPANGPILKALRLPLEYAISDAAKLGAETFLRRLDRRLEQGLGLMQWREKNVPDELAEQVAARCKAAGAMLMCNGDMALAARLGAGLHLNSAQLARAEKRPDFEWVAASCHDQRELERAAELELDFVVLSPVLPTPSHPGEPALGWPAFTALLRDCPLPVFALGGLGKGDLALARGHGAHGIALKSQAWSAD